MFKISLSTEKIMSSVVDCYGFVFEKDFDQSPLNEIKQFIPDLQLIVEKQKFAGNASDILSIPFVKDGRVAYCILAGIGAVDAQGISLIERYRRALGRIMQQVRAHKGASLALHLISVQRCKTTPFYLAQQTVIALKTAQYHFDDFITESNRKETVLTDVVLCADHRDSAEVQKAITEGTIIGDAVNQARHWVDTPPSHLTPQDLVKKAEQVAKKNNLGFTAFHEKDIITMGMGGLAAVSRGSEVDCALIILEYKAAQKDAPTLCFVGKGITFDSGGLSLKPADFMETMKEDMSGAAAVICAIDALAQLKPDINIIAIAPTSENLPSGKATKPGDIVTFYNGKTAEIKNTDAEGRLILADALSYAVKQYKPTAIVDLATLTGACSRALGPFYSGLFTEHEDVMNKLLHAADVSGDLLWRLPMGEDYKKAIVSTVADICNIGNSKIAAGASTAAHFLQNFVDDVPWAHIDIAGTAFDVPNIPYFRSGGTGVGVKLLVALAMNWK